jgi:hypothetical protein
MTMTTITTHEDQRPIRPMEFDALENHANDVLGALPENLSDEWVELMEQFCDPTLFETKNILGDSENQLENMFWVAVRIALRDLIAHDIDVRLPDKD